MDDATQMLRELFDNIDAAELAAMRERREEESLHLDFKRMSTSGEPNDPDKQNLRKAISGFANAAGGIILWGVESKDPENKHDRSRFHSLVPITDGDRAVVRFHELTGTATQPPVSGVVHKAIPVAGGYIVKTFVPASDGGPHRTNDELGQYYRRHADSFRAMQHHEIADMFGRRARPRLELCWEQDDSGWLIGVRNSGRGIARFPALTMRVHPAYGTLGLRSVDEYGFGLHRQCSEYSGIRIEAFTGGVNEVIHPGQTLHLTRVSLGSGIVCCIKYEIFAEHMQAVEGSFRFWSPAGFRLDRPGEDPWHSTP